MDVLLDLPLAFKMRYSRLTISTAYGTVNQVLHPRGFGGIRHRLALTNFTVVSRLVEVLHRKDALDPFQRPLEGRDIVEVAAHDFGPQFGQGPGGRLGRVAAQGAN
jgi:hypothetical protein